MVVLMVFMGLIFGVAGVLQTTLERILDIGYSNAHMTMMFWFKTVLFFGVIFLGGVLLTVYHLFTLKEGEVGGDR
jgi:nitric oxide reductase subunit B